MNRRAFMALIPVAPLALRTALAKPCCHFRLTKYANTITLPHPTIPGRLRVIYPPGPTTFNTVEVHDYGCRRLPCNG